MSLTKKQLKAREGSVTASFVPALMAGKQDRIMNEWRMLVGDPDYEPEDFTYNWPVNFGSYVEKFALNWHEKKTKQKFTHRGEFFRHPVHQIIGCTLDAFRESDCCVVDCKVTGRWMNLDDVIPYYTPQLYVQRACMTAAKMSLLIVHGGAEPVEYPIEFNEEYNREIYERILQFWHCVETLTPPYPMEAKAAPVEPVKEYDFSTSNEWCHEAGAWLEHRENAKKFEAAAKAIKSSVPDDAMRAFGGGVICSRSKSGSLSIKQEQPK